MEDINKIDDCTNTGIPAMVTRWNPVGDGLAEVVFVGDIHGEFGQVIYNCRQMEDTMFIYCGDIGMGFYKPGYYADTFRSIQGLCEKNNNAVIFVRGNHDDPRYFESGKIGTYDLELYPRIKMVRDWEIILAGDDAVLCGGGAVSVDRSHRQEGVSWWRDEGLRELDTEWLDSWLDENEYKIEHFYVATHTAPQEFPPTGNKGLLTGWAQVDPEIITDCANERKLLSDVLDVILHRCATQVNWMYGHFHENFEGLIYDDEEDMECGVRYWGLGINEKHRFIKKYDIRD